MSTSRQSFPKPRVRGRRQPVASILLASWLILNVHGAGATEPSPAKIIAIGDTADEVILRLKIKPDHVETYRLLGMTYELMTFQLSGMGISVRLLFDRVVAVDTYPVSPFEMHW
jgi:hypothetical protein